MHGTQRRSIRSLRGITTCAAAGYSRVSNFNHLKMKIDSYGVVYFVGAAESGPVKIGFTTDRTAASRLAQLQTASHEKLIVLGTVEAGPATERAIHKFLSAHLVRGEWFEREPTLVLFARLTDTSSLPHSSFSRRLMFSADSSLTSNRRDESLLLRVACDLVTDISRELSNVNTDEPLPFRSWLKFQVERNDSTGDLARDFSADCAFPDVGNLETYLEFIVSTNSRAALTRAVIDAWIECNVKISELRYVE